jgi:hypothetical protein
VPVDVERVFRGPPQLRRMTGSVGLPGALDIDGQELEEVPMSIVGGLDIHRSS